MRNLPVRRRRRQQILDRIEGQAGVSHLGGTGRRHPQFRSPLQQDRQPFILPCRGYQTVSAEGDFRVASAVPLSPGARNGEHDNQFVQNALRGFQSKYLDIPKV